MAIKPSAYEVPESVFQATEEAIEAAKHLTRMDAGAISAVLKIAKQIDYLMDNEGLNESGKFDNVSIPVFLKYCNELGLTPLARTKIEPAKTPGKIGKLGALQQGVAGAP